MRDKPKGGMKPQKKKESKDVYQDKALIKKMVKKSSLK